MVTLHAPLYTFAMQQARFPAAWELDVRTSGYRIRVRDESYPLLVDRTFPAKVDPRGRLDLSESTLLAPYLRSLTEPVEAELLGPSATNVLTSPWYLAGPWWVSFAEEHRVSWAARVVPNDPVVRAWIHPLSAWRTELESAPSQDFGETVDALVDHLVDLSRSSCGAQRGSSVNSGSAGQVTHFPVTLGREVRPPHAIFSLPAMEMFQGDYIEVALLLASALESLHVSPLLLVSPDRFLLGWKRVRSRGFRPVIGEVEELRTWIDRGVIGVLDPTALLAEDAEPLPGSRRMTSLGDWSGFGIDVRAARPDDGSVAPLDVRYDPIVERAIAWAEARPDPGTKIETLHLLTGLVHARAPLTQAVLGNDGEVDLARWAGTNDPWMVGRSVRTDMGRRRTVNYKVTLNHARDIATMAGSGVVRECDLLWSLVESSSRRIDHELASLAGSTGLVVDRLTRYCSGPGRSTRLG